MTARIDEEIDSTFDELGDREEFAPLAGRRGDAHDLLGMLAQSTTLGRNIRTHGDLHLGQVLWQGEDWLVIDFEGEPTRAASRCGGRRRSRCATSRACSDRSRTSPPRSTAPGIPAPRRGSRRRETGSSTGYRDTARGGGAPGHRRRRRTASSVMFELEKAFYELRYELDHRPDWVDIPVRSIATLLDRDAG